MGETKIGVNICYDYQHIRVKVFPIMESELELLGNRWTSASLRRRIVDRILSESKTNPPEPADE